MKKNYSRILIIFILISAFCPFTSYVAFSQTAPPAGINYQAVARDAGGNPLVSASVAVDFIIHSNNPTGPTVYSESQTVTTNPFGLFTLVIGSIDPATFSGIPWNADNFFLEVIVNGNNMGTTQFLSVPYALHSKTADSLVSPPAGALIWKRNADSVFLSTNTHNVGIGTSNPKEKLHIVDPGIGANPYVLLESMGGSFDLGYKIKTGGPNEWLLGKENGEFGLFKIKNLTSGFTGFSMSTTAFPLVGIGTNSPQSFFHVSPDRNFTYDSSFVVTSAGNVGIGTITPGVKLEVAGQVKITGGSPAIGAVLTSSDAAGLAAWQLPSGFTNMATFSVTTTWTVPAGVTKIMVEVWGGGGGGAGTGAANAAGGGGGGSYGKGIYTVTPSATLNVNVGNGGSSGTAGGGNGGAGGTSSVNTVPVISASGGAGGMNTGIGGSGGSSTAPFNISGGNGFYGSNTGFLSYGGNGANGGSGGLAGSPTIGGDGIVPSGGGGGSYAMSNSKGGNGASGRVVVWW